MEYGLIMVPRDRSKTFDGRGPWYNFFFSFFDMDCGLNLKYIKVTYKNKISFNLILAKK
jgi:hypothetical protein